jgi:calcineurin B family protein 1
VNKSLELGEKNVCFLFSVAFKMYDLDNDDKISKDELLAILHMMVGANIR